MVLERAKEAGAVTVGITNSARSTLARLADHTFFVRAGKEQSVAATKTYTGQVMMLYLLAYAAGAAIRPHELHHLADWVDTALRLESEIDERAERYRFMEHAVVVGRGLTYSDALEMALKLMETCYVVAERFSSADFLHGPIAMVEPSFPIFLFTPPGVTWPSLRETLEKLRVLKAETLIITDRGNPEAHRFEQLTRFPSRRRSGQKDSSRISTRLFRTSFRRNCSPRAWLLRRVWIRIGRER